MASLWDNPFAFLKGSFWRPNAFTQRSNTNRENVTVPWCPYSTLGTGTDITKPIAFYGWGDWGLERFNNTFNATGRKWRSKASSLGMSASHTQLLPLDRSGMMWGRGDTADGPWRWWKGMRKWNNSRLAQKNGGKKPWSGRNGRESETRSAKETGPKRAGVAQ